MKNKSKEIKMKDSKQELMLILQQLHSKLDKVDAKMDGLDKRLDESNIIQTKQQVILDEHIRRTEANETLINKLDQKVDERIKIEDKIIFLGKAIMLVGGIIFSVISFIKIVLELL